MEQINNLPTQNDYTDALTLGPDDFEALSVDVWNNAVLMQTYDAPGGHWQQGQWGAEQLVAPSSITLQRCAGVRFKTNPAAGSTAGRVVAAGWRSGEVLVTGGVQLLGTLSGSGSIVPPVGTVQVASNNILVGSEPQINLIDGNAISWNVGDDAANTRINVLAMYAPAYNSYVPAFTTSNGDGLIGNGFTNGRYIQVGKLVHCYGRLVGGATTNFGTGTFRISLPVNSGQLIGGADVLGSSYMFDNSAGAYAAPGVQIDGANAGFMIFRYPAAWPSGALTDASSAAPWVWAVNDQIHWSVTYESV